MKLDMNQSVCVLLDVVGYCMPVATNQMGWVLRCQILPRCEFYPAELFWRSRSKCTSLTDVAHPGVGEKDSSNFSLCVCLNPMSSAPVADDLLILAAFFETLFNFWFQLVQIRIECDWMITELVQGFVCVDIWIDISKFDQIITGSTCFRARFGIIRISKVLRAGQWILPLGSLPKAYGKATYKD